MLPKGVMMKKYLIIILIVSFLFLFGCALFFTFIHHEKTIEPQYLPDKTIEFTFKNQEHSQYKARKIVYRHILKAMNKNSGEIIKESNKIPDNIYAYFIDLNNDGKKDIIGIEKEAEYHRFTVFILMRNKWKFWEYESKKSFLMNGWFKKLYILNTKTNNYNDIRAYGIFKTYGNDCILKYDLKSKYYEFYLCK